MMKMFSCLFLGMLVSGISVAQEKLLPPTYEIGKEYVLKMVQDMETDMSAMAGLGAPGAKQTVKMEATTTIVCVQDPANAEQRLVKTAITGMKMDMNMGPIEMKYDSEDPESKDSLLGAQMEGMIDQELTMVMDSNGKILEMRGLDQLPGGAGQAINGEQMKQMMMPGLSMGIGAAGVSIGDSWKNDQKISLGPMGDVSIGQTLTYEKDDENGLAVVKYTGAGGLDGEKVGGPVPLEIKKMDMKGSYHIDKNLRHFRSGDATVDMELEMGNPQNPAEKIPLPITQKITFSLLSVKDVE